MITKKIFAIVISIGLCSTQVNSQSLLWDPGIKRSCYLHFLMPGDVATSFRDTSDCLSNAERNFCHNFGAQDYSCPHWYALSYNWSINTKTQNPGWDYTVGDSNDGYVLHGMANNAKNVAQIGLNPCDLYEVAFSSSWSNASFKRNSGTSPYTLGQFDNVRLRFDARVDHVTGGTCPSESRAFLHTDIVLVFPNSEARSIQIVIFNPENLDFNNNANDEILWEGNIPSGTIVALHGNKLSDSVCQGCGNYLSGSFQSYNVRYKALFERYQSPPSQYSWNDAEIQHVQLTSSNRGYDSTVYLKNIDVYNGASDHITVAEEHVSDESKDCVDNDGDGWGWNGVRSCQMGSANQASTEASTEASAEPECVDNDGDGWGWNGTRSCQVGMAVNNVSAAPECIDSDGDGWGWNGVRSCQTENSNAGTAQAECIDTDGDGWGWNGVGSCVMANVEE